MPLTLDQKLKIFRQLQKFCSAYSRIAFYCHGGKKSRWKVQVNVVKPQKLKMVCGESNEINGKKMFCVRPLRKKLLAFDKV